MPLEIRHKNNNSILMIHYAPEPETLPVSIFLLYLSTAFLFLGDILFGVVMMGVIAIPTVFVVWKTRKIRCIINREAGVFSYTKYGILGSRYDIQSMQYNVTEIVALEMKRYVRREWGDKFQIRLALRGNRKLPLSSANLNFSKCQSCASEIHQFLGVDIALRAID